MKRARAALAISAALILAPGVADAAARAAGPQAALHALRDQDRRVLAIGWRLSEAAADLCDDARPGLGWTLHDLDQYRPGLRPAVASAFGLNDGDLGVMALAPDGPAARGGVREGDVVLSFGRRRFDAARAPTRQADYAPMARALRDIEAETAAAPIPVRVRREGRVVDLVVRPRGHCPWPVQVEPSSRLFAASDGVRISVSSAMADHAVRDDDLAFVIAHEMAHNLRRPEETGARRGSRAREEAADRAGLILAARAGYDTSGAAAFVTRLGRTLGRRPFDGHPPTPARAEALARLHAWIVAERHAGRPLRP